MIASIEESLLPPEDPLMVVARINSLLKVQWWMHDREHGRAAKINPPELPELSKQALDRILRKLKTSPTEEVATVALQAVRADIPLDSDWVPDTSVFKQRPLYLGEPEFRLRTVDDWPGPG